MSPLANNMSNNPQKNCKRPAAMFGKRMLNNVCSRHARTCRHTQNQGPTRKKEMQGMLANTPPFPALQALLPLPGCSTSSIHCLDVSALHFRNQAAWSLGFLGPGGSVQASESWLQAARRGPTPLGQGAALEALCKYRCTRPIFSAGSG